MVLGKVNDILRHTAAEGAEIAGVGVEFDTGQVIDDAVKVLFEEPQHLALPTAILIGGHHIVFRLLLQNGHHVPDDLRPLLEVGVDEGDVVAGGLLKAGVNGGLLAEIPGQGNHLHRAFLGGEELFQTEEGIVPAAVVDKDDFIVIAAVVEGIVNRVQEQINGFLFIITGNHQGKLQGASTHFFTCRKRPLAFSARLTLQL